MTVAQLVSLALALAATGVVSGTLAGLFGIGGGAVIVPVLYQALGLMGFPDTVNMHVALGTSLAIIVPTAMRSFQAHHARGAVDMSILRSWILPVPLGVVAASFVAASLSGAGLRAIFAAIAFLVGLKLVFQRDGWRLAADVPGGVIRAVWGGLIGFFATLMGIGGGILSNTFLSLYGRPIHQSVATSSGVGVLISVPGAIGYMAAGWNADDLPPLSIGYVNLLGVAIVMPLSLLVAPLGVRLAHALKKRQLEAAFGIFLILISARFAASLF